MPPSAHTLAATMMTTMTQSTKPKIGFSIDSIVGTRNQHNKSPINFSHDSEGSEAPLSPLSDYGYQHSNNSPKHNDLAMQLKLNEYAQIELRNKIKRSLSTSPPANHHHHHHHQQQQQHHHHHEKNMSMENDIQRHEIQKLPHDSQTRLSSSDDRRSQSPQSPPPSSKSHHQQNQHHQQQHQQHMQKPLVVPGIPASILRPVHGTQLPPSITQEMMAAQNPFFRLGTFQLLPT